MGSIGFMSGTADPPRSYGGPLPDGVLCVGVLAIGCAGFLLLRNMVHGTIEPDHLTKTLGVLGFVSAAGIPLTYAALTPAVRIFFRVIWIIPLLFFLGAGFPIISEQFPELSHALVKTRVFGLALALLALWRPSFLLGALFAMSLYRQLLGATYVSALSQTDMAAAIEGPAILLIVLAVARWASIAPHVKNHTALFDWHDCSAVGQPTRSAQEYVFLGVVAVHLANYFYSGHEKLILPGGPFHWLLHNPTSALAENAMELGAMPLTHWPAAAMAAIAVATVANPIVNFFTLGSQLFAPIAVFRKSWLLAITLAYDLMHAGIFLLTGIFFWKWMVLNAAIVFALAKMKSKWPPLVVTASACLIVFLAPLMFHIARLGWYDTRQITFDYAEAVTAGGEKIRVPSNFFFGYSIGLAQMDASRLWKETSVATRTWGATADLSVFEAGNQCKAANDGAADDPQRQAAIARLVGDVHRTALANVGKDGRLAYDLYAHHIWSDPFAYGDFYRLDKRTIVAYNWVERIVCVDHRPGQDSRVMAERSMVIPVSSNVR